MIALAVMTAVALVAALPADARADEPLRRRWPLLPLVADLGADAIAPPITTKTLTNETIEACVPSHYPNPWSPLPDGLRRLDQRVTLATFPGGRFEMRDALLVPTPRALSFELVAPAEAALELAYHLFPCRGRGDGVQLRISIDDPDGHIDLRVPLPPQKHGDPRWPDVHVPLPVAAGSPMRLTLAFEIDGVAIAPSGAPAKPAKPAKAAPIIALNEPVVSGLPSSPDDDPRRDTNVLWIVIDSARTDALGPARTLPAPSPTPNLDRLFEAGTAFTHAYAMSNQTRTSTTAMIGSVHPSIGGFQSHDWALARSDLADFYRDRPAFLTHLLHDAGWFVQHIGDNNFLWASNRSGIDVDFPVVDDYRVDEQDARLATSAAIDFMRAHRADRWFLMLEYLAPHTPYKPPPEWQEAADALPGPDHLGANQHLPRSYIGELMWVDHNVADLLAHLDESALSQNTLVIVTADHGEVMLRWHDCASARVKLRCGFNHSVTVYDDELRVPLTFHLPGRVAARVVDTPVSHADIVPTVLELVGLAPASGAAGRSIAGVLYGAPELAPEPIYADGRLASALREGDLKLILHASDDDAATRARATPKGGEYAPHELFDLEADPDERTNLSEARPETVTSLLARMDEWRAELKRRFEPAVTKIRKRAAVTEPSPDALGNRRRR